MSEPAPMSDEDVTIMAGDGSASLRRRIARHSPAGRTGKLGADKLPPAEISAAEMRRIQPRGRLTKALRERLAAAAQADRPVERAAEPKQSPKREPEAR